MKGPFMVITLVFSSMPFDNCVSNSLEVSLDRRYRRDDLLIVCCVYDRRSFNLLKLSTRILD